MYIDCLVLDGYYIRCGQYKCIEDMVHVLEEVIVCVRVCAHVCASGHVRVYEQLIIPQLEKKDTRGLTGGDRGT